VPEEAQGEFILGIDLGTNSIGWAVIGLVDGEPTKLIRAGVRVFEAGMDGDLESGREESRNRARRDARLRRRQLWRHRRRLIKVAHILQRAGLLPEGNAGDPEAHQNFFNCLDSEILASDWFASKEKSGAYPEPRHVMPYILRASALDGGIEPHLLGRAIYHLGQRRGFQSNRLKPAKKDDDEGVVKEGIGELRRKIQEAGARTLGEYFSGLSPSEERIRSRWTARDMYEKEFDAIWSAQAGHRPGLLTEGRRKELRKAIFFQRPLWFDPNSIGTCELEPACRRALAYLLVSQRFRLLQTVNNLRILPPGEPERSLTPKDREKLTEALELRGDLTFIQIRKLLGLTKEYTFTLERGGEKRLRGNRTNADFCEVFGERWLGMSAEERDGAVEYVHAFQKPEKLPEAAKKKWGLDDKAAEKLPAISLEADYMSLSRRAMEKLLPLLEAGVTYGEARRQLYPELFQASEPKPLLPPVELALAEIRNPAVTRSLTELRKVVNSIVRIYGMPAQIRIELARDLKRSKKDRQSLTQRNRDNEEAGERMKKKILQEASLATRSRTDIRKALLHEECGGICPYTGKPIDFRHLFGPESQFDIEHIIPYERCFDNSFSNLTLCHNEENRHVKGKRTPWEAYHADEARFEEILDRVKRFHSPSARSKLWRFQMTETEATEFVSKFVSRQLNDTRYASRLAARYVAMLYGGLSDDEHSRRVQVTSGEVTAQLRRSWLLNQILNDGPTAGGGEVPKRRDDHRHHAVDAVAIALTDDSTIQQLSRAAERARHQGQRKLGNLEGPWPNFVDSVRQAIRDEVTQDGVFKRAVVSHRVSKKVSGALHEETTYSRPFPVAAMSSSPKSDRRSETVAREVRVRKPLASLSRTEVGDIADPKVKELVVKKLQELGGDPKKFPPPGSRENLDRFPCFVAQDGRRIPIKRVRVNKAVPTFPLGEGKTIRHVTPESNHHVEIYSVRDKKGRERWDGEVVSMHESYERVKNRKSLVEKNHGPLAEFKFSLAPGEAVECASGKGGRGLFVMRKVSQLSKGGITIGLAPVNDARQAREMQTSRAWLWSTPDRLRERSARKVGISPLGEVSESHE